MDNRNEIGRTLRMALGAGHLVLGIGVAMVPLVALGARYTPVDLTLGLVAVLLAASGGALLGGIRQGPMLARIASAVALVAGLAFLTALVWTASYLKGIYGDLGRGASAFFVLIAFTILPYLVVYPGIALALLRPRPITPEPAPAAPEQRRAE